MRIGWVGFFKDRPHHEWYKGVLEGSKALGIEGVPINCQWVDVKDPKDDQPAAVLGMDKLDASGYDVIVVMIYDSLLHPGGVKRLKEHAKKLVLWYPDAYPRSKGLRDEKVWKQFDYLFITNTAQLDWYRKEYGRPVDFLPQGCLDLPWHSDPPILKAVSFVGTRWNFANPETRLRGGKDDPPHSFFVWERTKVLGVLSQLHPIDFYPADGFYDHESFKDSVETYRHYMVNLALNRYKSLPHSQSIRTWNIVAASGLCLTNHAEGLGDLFRPGEIAVFDCEWNYKKAVEDLLEHPDKRESLRRKGWEAAQGRHLYKYRIRRMLEILGI